MFIWDYGDFICHDLIKWWRRLNGIYDFVSLHLFSFLAATDMTPIASSGGGDDKFMSPNSASQ